MGCCCNSLCAAQSSLREVYVVIDMILTEAVIPRTLGAIAELKLGMVNIRAAADGALMRIEISLLLTLDALRLAAEIDGVAAGALRQSGEQVAAAEDEEVYRGDDGQEIRREARGENAVDEKRRVDIRKVFYLDGDDVEKQHLHVREQHSDGEEHGEIDILRSEVEALPRDEIDGEAVYHGQDNAREKVDIELRRAPAALQRAADEIIKVKDEKGQYARAGRVEGEGHKPPYLPVQNIRRIEGQIAEQRRVHRADDPEHHICNGDVFDKVGDAEIGVLRAEALNTAAWIFHHVSPVPRTRRTKRGVRLLFCLSI